MSLALLAISCLIAGLAAASVSASDSAPAAQKIDIVEFRFTPGRIVVPAGGKLKIVNTSTYTHTATHPGKGGFDTGHIPPGESAYLTFEKPGTYAFHCVLHRFMTGKVVVK